MPKHYLNVPYSAKDAAKALGARFDGTVKRWYVESGCDLTPFGAWLPVADGRPRSDVAVSQAQTGDLAVASPKSLTLSQLLGGVASAVSRAFDGGVWVLAEVVQARTKGGHVYLELSERDSLGNPIAKAQAVIWAMNATRILPVFERETGVVIGAGIKLLIRARPVFKAQYGFSLDIDAIDPEYTLGDLEARKREIRVRLQQEGLFEKNKRLTSPWDFQLVLVIAPEGGAGLGDFQKEANRLSEFGICDFVYVYSRLQGDGAAREIVEAISSGLARMGRVSRPDVIVIIRGGGATNDLAWLNDYELVKFICMQDIPVFTGIGHERDSTLPDEVANACFDTPSKVIAGIEQKIARRTREAGLAAQEIFAHADRSIREARTSIQRDVVQVGTSANAEIARAHHGSAQGINKIGLASVRMVNMSSRNSLSLLSEVRSTAVDHLAWAAQKTPQLISSIRAFALSALGEARANSTVAANTVLDRAGASVRAWDSAVREQMHRLVERSEGSLRQAKRSSQALMREVAGQGPEKTLKRGFAIARTKEGEPITSKLQASQASTVKMQFWDGAILAQVQTTREEN